MAPDDIDDGKPLKKKVEEIIDGDDGDFGQEIDGITACYPPNYMEWRVYFECIDRLRKTLGGAGFHETLISKSDGLEFNKLLGDVSELLNKTSAMRERAKTVDDLSPGEFKNAVRVLANDIYHKKNDTSVHSASRIMRLALDSLEMTSLAHKLKVTHRAFGRLYPWLEELFAEPNTLITKYGSGTNPDTAKVWIAR